METVEGLAKATPPTVAPPKKTTDPHRYSLRAIGAGGFGNFIQLYDAVIYGLLAPVFTLQFFPNASVATSLFYTYGVLLVTGFVVRPISAVVLSPIGDRLGRRRLLSLTLLLMGLGITIVALTPSYATIGWLSPVIFNIGRVIQNFSLGGEVQAASTFIVEHSPPRRRATLGSVNAISGGLGVLFASGVAAAVTNLLPPEAVSSYGWRLAFLFGGVLSLYGVYLRRQVPETPAFIAVQEQGKEVAKPTRTTFKEHPKSLFLVFGVQLSAMFIFVWQVFLPTYANLAGGLALSTGLWITTVNLVIFTVLLPFVGILSDNLVGRKPLLVFSTLGFALLTYPMFQVLQSPTPTEFFVVSLVGNLLLVPWVAIGPAQSCELFPAAVRTTGIGVSANIAIGVFGTSTPVLAAWSLAHGMNMMLAFYLMLMGAVVALTFIFKLPETRKKELD